MEKTLIQRHGKDIGRILPPVERSLWSKSASSIADTEILSKSSCACGGGCPACRAKSNLNISQPNDPAEIEADRIADKVMRMPVFGRGD